MNDYEALRDYLARQTLNELTLGFEEIEEIVGHALPRASHRASWWDSLRSPQEKMPQREACLAAGYVATRLPDGKGVRFQADEAEITGRNRLFSALSHRPAPSRICPPRSRKRVPRLFLRDQPASPPKFAYFYRPKSPSDQQSCAERRSFPAQ